MEETSRLLQENDEEVEKKERLQQEEDLRKMKERQEMVNNI